MFWDRTASPLPDVFSHLPIRHITVGNGNERLAVHVSGDLDQARLPLVCLADYHRNMSDYAGFAERYGALGDNDRAIILIDLLGRGRSSRRKTKSNYTSVHDAKNVSSTLASMGIERAVLLGQGYGGQVLMALSSFHPQLIVGAILLNSGPITDTPGLVRLRDNLQQIAILRGERQFQATTRMVYGLGHPSASETELDEIALRTHYLDAGGQAKPWFDPYLVSRLDDLQMDDVFEPQWPLFATFGHAELLLIRTQLTESLQRATFERMLELRPNAVQLQLEAQGAPVSLAGENEFGAVVKFIEQCNAAIEHRPIVAG